MPDAGPISRSDLGEVIGFSRPTVDEVVKALCSPTAPSSKAISTSNSAGSPGLQQARLLHFRARPGRVSSRRHRREQLLVVVADLTACPQRRSGSRQQPQQQNAARSSRRVKQLDARSAAASVPPADAAADSSIGTPASWTVVGPASRVAPRSYDSSEGLPLARPASSASFPCSCSSTSTSSLLTDAGAGRRRHRRHALRPGSARHRRRTARRTSSCTANSSAGGSATCRSTTSASRANGLEPFEHAAEQQHIRRAREYRVAATHAATACSSSPAGIATPSTRRSSSRPRPGRRSGAAVRRHARAPLARSVSVDGHRLRPARRHRRRWHLAHGHHAARPAGAGAARRSSRSPPQIVLSHLGEEADAALDAAAARGQVGRGTPARHGVAEAV